MEKIQVMEAVTMVQEGRKNATAAFASATKLSDLFEDIIERNNSNNNNNNNTSPQTVVNIPCLMGTWKDTLQEQLKAALGSDRFPSVHFHLKAVPATARTNRHDKTHAEVEREQVWGIWKDYLAHSTVLQEVHASNLTEAELLELVDIAQQQQQGKQNGGWKQLHITSDGIFLSTVIRLIRRLNAVQSSVPDLQVYLHGTLFQGEDYPQNLIQNEALSILAQNCYQSYLVHELDLQTSEYSPWPDVNLMDLFCHQQHQGKNSTAVKEALSTILATLALNQAGRRYVLQDASNKTLGLVAVLSSASVNQNLDAIFSHVRDHPNLLCERHVEATTTTTMLDRVNQNNNKANTSSSLASRLSPQSHLHHHYHHYLSLRRTSERKMSSWLIMVLVFLGALTVFSTTANAKPYDAYRQAKRGTPSPFIPASSPLMMQQNVALNIPRGGGRSKASKKGVVPKSSKSNNNSNKVGILTSVFNLSNNVAGAGILTLAAGKATGTGWIPSILISISLAFCSAHTFTLIGKACEMTGHDTFKGLWGDAFGTKTAWIVDSMVFTQCFFVSIIYTGLLGDIFSALLSSTSLAGIASRTRIIIAAAVVLLWPLNMLDMTKLGFTSILGLVAVLYTVFFIALRSLDGTYAIAIKSAMEVPVGKFVKAAPFMPTFAKSTLWNFDMNSLVLMSNLGLAFIAHYNGPTYWKSLADASTERFRKVSFSAYAILATIYTTTMVAGYATFGDVCQGNILLNYSPNDFLAFLGRLATGLSIIFGFPLISNGAREGLKNASSALGYSTLSKPENKFKLVSCLLFTTTLISIFLTDIKLVTGLVGAVMGSALVYICPTMIYARIVQQRYGANSPEYQVAKRNLLFIPFGLFTASMGVFMTLKNTVLAK